MQNLPSKQSCTESVPACAVAVVSAEIDTAAAAIAAARRKDLFIHPSFRLWPLRPQSELKVDRRRRAAAEWVRASDYSVCPEACDRLVAELSFGRPASLEHRRA